MADDELLRELVEADVLTQAEAYEAMGVEFGDDDGEYEYFCEYCGYESDDSEEFLGVFDEILCRDCAVG